MKSQSQPKKQTKDADQLKAFRKAARERGADLTDGQFQDALRKIAKAKPQQQAKKEK